MTYHLAVGCLMKIWLDHQQLTGQGPYLHHCAHTTHMSLRDNILTLALPGVTILHVHLDTVHTVSDLIDHLLHLHVPSTPHLLQ